MSATQLKKWLFMVYMQAGDSSQLDSLAVQDLLEMEEGVRRNPNVTVLVQIKRKWPGAPQRYLLESRGHSANGNGTKPSLATAVQIKPARLDGDTMNMGSGEALADFVAAGYKLNAAHNCLVLWGHAFGLGFGRIHSDPLTLKELGDALAKQKTREGRKLDVLATNACTMSYIEAAYQIRDSVDYFVASQAFVPLTGLPYKRILRSIGHDTSPPVLGRMIADRYLEDFSDSRIGDANAAKGEKVAMSVLHLNTTALEGIRSSLDKLAGAIIKIVDSGEPTEFDDRLDEIRDVFLANPAGDVRPVLDLYSLAKDLIAFCDDRLTGMSDHHRKLQARHFDDLCAAAQELAKAIQPAVIRKGDDVRTSADANGSIVEYHCEHPDLEGMNGVGIFAPFVVEQSYLKELELADEGRDKYKALRIFKGKPSNSAKHAHDNERWVSLVYDRLRLDDDDLDEIVDISGVVRPAHRIQVNQLVRAVDAAFNKLGRALPKAKARVVNELRCKREPNSGRPLHILRTFGPPRLRLAGDVSLSWADPSTPFAPVVGTIGPLHLKLAGDMSLRDYLGEKGLVPAPEQAPAELRLDPVVQALASIESAVRLVEKTTTRVITNRTFGLGPPKPANGMQLPLHLGPKPSGQELGPKQSGQELGPKQSGQELGPKPSGQELGPKPSGQELGSDTGAFLAFMSPNPPVASLAVATLIGCVASSLVGLERATADIEAMVAQCLFAPHFGELLSDEDYAATIEGRFKEAFDVLTEVALQARRTIRQVLGHPVYGLGLGPDGFGQAERDALATASGLNRRNLALLAGS